MDLGLFALLAGLLLFLGLHSIRMWAPQWREAQIKRLGLPRWMALFSLASGVGLALLMWGYAQARHTAPLFAAPPGMRHATALLVLLAFWLLAAAYVPRNHLKAAVRHPMTLSVKLWALAHLLVNHTAADFLLFGSFLVWSVLLFRAARRRPQEPSAGTVQGTVLALVLGTAAYAGFAFWLHGAWLGVQPFAR